MLALRTPYRIKYELFASSPLADVSWHINEVCAGCLNSTKQDGGGFHQEMYGARSIHKVRE